MNLPPIDSSKMSLENATCSKAQIETHLASTKRSIDARSSSVQKIAQSCFDCQKEVDVSCLELLEQMAKEERITACFELANLQQNKVAPIIDKHLRPRILESHAISKVKSIGDSAATSSSSWLASNLSWLSSIVRCSTTSDNSHAPQADISGGLEEFLALQAAFNSRCSLDMKGSVKLFTVQTRVKIADLLSKIMQEFVNFDQKYPRRFCTLMWEYRAERYPDEDGRQGFGASEFNGAYLEKNLELWYAEAARMNEQLTTTCQLMSQQMDTMIDGLLQEQQKTRELQHCFANKALRSMSDKYEIIRNRADRSPTFL